MSIRLSILAALLLSAPLARGDASAWWFAAAENVSTSTFEFSDVAGLTLNLDSSTLDATTNLAYWPSCCGTAYATNGTVATRPEVVALPSGYKTVNFKSDVNGIMDLSETIHVTNGIHIYFAYARTNGTIAASIKTASGTYPYGFSQIANNSTLAALFTAAKTYTTRTNNGLVVASLRLDGTNQYCRYNSFDEESANGTLVSGGTLGRIGIVGTGSYHDGYYYQLLIYINAAMTADEDAAIRNKLYNKWVGAQ